MAGRRYEISYPDGSRKKVSCRERDSLLLTSEIKQIAPQQYAYNGQVRTYHSFADLAELKTRLNMPATLIRRYLAGHFVRVEQRTGKRKHELLETPESMALRLEMA